jgi:flagellar basal body-associated protein FliL
MSANESDTNPAPGGSSKKSSNALIPIIVVILLVPALCYGVMEFLIIPKLKSSMGGGGDTHAKTADHGKGDGGSHKDKKEITVPFEPIVVNLAGSGNSRYLRVTFVLASTNEKLTDKVKENQAALEDAAMTILTTQSMDVNNVVTGKEVVRKGIIQNFNRLLGTEMINQVYFKEFIVQ